MSNSTEHSQPVHARKTVAFCIEALTVGGAEQMLVAMANQFVLRGWQVHMICLTKEGELAANLDSQVVLHVLGKKPGADRQLPIRLRKLLVSLAPQAVNCHLWTANLWTRLSLIGTGIPVVATEHSRDFWKPSHYRFLDRRLARFTHRLVAVSEDTAQFYRDDIRLPKALVSVINNGVNTQRYAEGNGEALHAQWAPNGELLVGTVGRMVSAKNHLRLLDMAVLLRKRFPDCKVVLVGDGPERTQIEAGIAERQLQDTVILAGARSDIPDVLAAFDVFVLSSDREGHPLTALEAQAAGTPVVLTNAGGSADAVALNTDQPCQLCDSVGVVGDVDAACQCLINVQRGGFLVNKSSEALAARVALLANDKALLSNMGSFAQSYALAHFDLQHMVDQYEALFLGASQ